MEPPTKESWVCCGTKSGLCGGGGGADDAVQAQSTPQGITAIPRCQSSLTRGVLSLTNLLLCYTVVPGAIRLLNALSFVCDSLCDE